MYFYTNVILSLLKSKNNKYIEYLNSLKFKNYNSINKVTIIKYNFFLLLF